MKARIKHSDKIIDVEWNMFGWLFDSPEGKRIFNTEELEFLDSDDNIDWQSFRAEAAKNILSNSLIPYALKESSEELINIDYWTGIAIEWTDTLVKKLKEKEEK